MINKEKLVRKFTEAVATEARRLLDEFDTPWHQLQIMKRGLRFYTIIEFRSGEKYREESEQYSTSDAEAILKSTVIEQQGLTK